MKVQFVFVSSLPGELGSAKGKVSEFFVECMAEQVYLLLGKYAFQESPAGDKIGERERTGRDPLDFDTETYTLLSI